MFLTDQDIHEISIPDKLYGRDKELKWLEHLFDSKGEGSKLVLIHGPSGFGKTSLVRAFAKEVTTKRNVLFFRGKLDVSGLNRPYEVIVQTLSQIIDYWIIQDVEDELRSVLTKHLTLHAREVIALFPQIERYFTFNDNYPHISTQHSVNEALLSFFNALEELEQDIILFLDDLQWADSSTLSFLDMLVSEGKMNHIFVVGAYQQDEEMSHQHLLNVMKGKKDGAEKVCDLGLTTLNLPELKELVEDSVKLQTDHIHDVSECILQCTGGNPLFVSSSVNRLVHVGALNFSEENGHWEYTPVKNKPARSASRTTELIQNKIEQLSYASQEFLLIGSAVGNSFSSTIVAAVSGKPFHNVNEGLMEASEKGLISLAESYNRDSSDRWFVFNHDKIQETAYSMMNKNRRDWVHYSIGKTYDNSLGYAASDRHIFDIVNHYNKSKSHFNTKNEKEKLLEMNFSAARKAKEMGGYDQTLTYLDHALVYLLNEKPGENKGSLYRAYYESGVAAYLIGNYVKSTAFLEDAYRFASTTFEKAKIQHNKLLIHIQINDLESAWNSGVKALRLLGLAVPSKVSAINIMVLYLKMKSRIARYSEEELLSRTNIHDEVEEQKLLTLMELLGPAWQRNRSNIAFVVLKGLDLFLKGGNTPVGHFAVSGFGTILGMASGKPQKGWKYVKLGEKLAHRYDSSFFQGRASIGVYGVYSHYIVPAKENLGKIKKVFHDSKKAGDYTIAAQASVIVVENILVAGEKLDVISKEAASYIQFLRRIGKYEHLTCHKGSILSVEQLSTGPKSTHEQLQKIEARMELINQDHLKLRWHIHQLMVAVIIDDHAKMQLHLERILEGECKPLSLLVMLYSIFVPAACLALYDDWNNENIKLKNVVKQQLSNVRRSARTNPDNYDHILSFLEGIKAEMNKKQELAISHYQEATRLAQQYGFIHYEAFFTEKLSNLLDKQGRKSEAQSNMVKTIALYSEWGALWKVKQLEGAK